MNKKTVTITSGALGLILLTACGGTETYSYQVSGVVQAQQVDYDCPGEDIAMDAVAYVAGSGKGSSSGGGSGKKSNNNSDNDSDVSSSDKKAPASKAPASKAPSTSGGGGTTSKAPSSPAPSKTPSNKGVKLKDKPEKAEKLKGLKVPKVKYAIKPKGCETEYEIFVLSGNTLYEQDVRRVDYDKCLTAKTTAGKKLFPLCTKG
jgi:hypothetical protein